MKHLTVIILCMACVLYYSSGNAQKIDKKKVTIGMIGKMDKNPVFVAAHTGALLAAKELGKKYGVEVVIKWQAPPEKESVEEQASALQNFARTRVDGIAISCTDADYLTNIINSVVDKGIPVLCFDSDAPKSKRFAYYGANDIEFGKSLAREMAKVMNNKGRIAVLAGNKVALNLQRRLQGIKEEIKKYPEIDLPEEYIFHNIDVPNLASAVVAREQAKHPDIQGWIFVTSPPLLMENSLKWNPGEVKVVGGHAVPAQLKYVKSGHVQTLVGINCFLLGYKSIEILLDKILYNKHPKDPFVYTPLIPVNHSNVEEWSLNWKKWLLKEAVYK